MGKNRLKSLILNDVAHFFVRSSFEGHLCYDDLLAWNTTIIINMSTTSTLGSTQNDFQNQDWVWFHYGSCPWPGVTVLVTIWFAQACASCCD